MTWRHATREEIYAYYTEEFPTYLDDRPEFLTATGPKQYAIAFGTAHPVRKDGVPDRDFIRRDTWRTNSAGQQVAPEFDSFDEVIAFIQHPARNDPLADSQFALADPDLVDAPDPRPHAVYFALDNWDRSWILLVDIDAKDIARQRAQQRDFAAETTLSEDELLERAGIMSAPPAGYPYTFEDLDRAIEYGFQLRDIFITDFDAGETLVMYTGQGVHVYLLDRDPAHQYDEKSREVLNDLLLDHYDIPIDPVVTADRRRVARLPYSLHAEVCRVVQPISDPSFDPLAATPEVIE